jgi:hypothetical protein
MILSNLSYLLVNLNDEYFSSSSRRGPSRGRLTFFTIAALLTAILAGFIHRSAGTPVMEAGITNICLNG